MALNLGESVGWSGDCGGLWTLEVGVAWMPDLESRLLHAVTGVDRGKRPLQGPEAPRDAGLQKAVQIRAATPRWPREQ